jgi:O-antigen ligase
MTTDRVVAAALPLAILTPLALDAGGFFPTAWGFTGLALLAVAAIALLLRDGFAIGRIETVWLTLVGVYAAFVLGSSVWSIDPTQSVLAGERAAVYPLGLLAAVLVVRRESAGRMLAGLVATGSLIALIALATRILPGVFGRANDPVATGQLYAPIGYWNGLACMMAMGLALTVGLWLDPQARHRSLLLAVAAPQLLALLLTESRGAVGGLIVGGMICAALRLRSRAGRRLAGAAVLATVVVIGVAIGSSAGGPRGSGDAAVALTGRGALWSVSIDQFEAHPLAGAGAGTWQAYWSRLRPHSRDVGNPTSLYLQALGELGIVGLVMLVVVLTLPVAVAVRVASPGDSFVPAAAGAYAVLLVDAAVDWDWELPAVFLFGLWCAVAILIAARREQAGRRLRPLRRGAAVAACAGLAVLVAAGLVGNSLISSSATAVAAGRYSDAVTDARSAGSWMPWSYLPATWRGEAELAAGNRPAAAAAFRAALAKPRGSGVWRLWWNLARATSGAEQAGALRRAIALDPLSPEVRAFCASLAPTAGSQVEGVCLHLPRRHHKHHGGV